MKSRHMHSDRAIHAPELEVELNTNVIDLETCQGQAPHAGRARLSEFEQKVSTRVPPTIEADRTNLRHPDKRRSVGFYDVLRTNMRKAQQRKSGAKREKLALKALRSHNEDRREQEMDL